MFLPLTLLFCTAPTQLTCTKKIDGELAWLGKADGITQAKGCVHAFGVSYEACLQKCRNTPGCIAVGFRTDIKLCTAALPSCISRNCERGCWHADVPFVPGSDIAQATGSPSVVVDLRKTLVDGKCVTITPAPTAAPSPPPTIAPSQVPTKIADRKPTLDCKKEMHGQLAYLGKDLGGAQAEGCLHSFGVPFDACLQTRAGRTWL